MRTHSSHLWDCAYKMFGIYQINVYNSEQNVIAGIYIKKKNPSPTSPKHRKAITTGLVYYTKCPDKR